MLPMEADDGFNVSFNQEPAMQQQQTFMAKWGPLFTFFGGLFAMLSSLSVFSSKYPQFARWLMIVGGLAIAGGLLFYILKAIRFAMGKLADRKYIRVQEAKLRDLLAHFKPFVANENSMSLRGILRSFNDEAAAKLAAPETSDLWADCLLVQLESPSRSLVVLAHRAREFSLLLTDFIGNQAQRLQREITTTGKPPHTTYIDMLEEFHDDFNAFLRELEQWVGPFNEYVIPRIGWQGIPNSKFQRIKSFRRGIAAGS